MTAFLQAPPLLDALLEPAVFTFLGIVLAKLADVWLATKGRNVDEGARIRGELRGDLDKAHDKLDTTEVRLDECREEVRQLKERIWLLEREKQEQGMRITELEARLNRIVDLDAETLRRRLKVLNTPPPADQEKDVG